MDLKHNQKKKTLKIIGFIGLGIGLICVIIAFVNFFSSINNGGLPNMFYLFFIGFPLIAISGGLLGMGYRREVSQYIKDEGIPVFKDGYKDIRPEIKDFRDIMKGDSNAVICPKCGTSNSVDDRFCKNCGTPIEKISCPFCGELQDADAKFCTNCGKALER